MRKTVVGPDGTPSLVKLSEVLIISVATIIKLMLTN